MNINVTFTFLKLKKKCLSPEIDYFSCLGGCVLKVSQTFKLWILSCTGHSSLIKKDVCHDYLWGSCLECVSRDNLFVEKPHSELKDDLDFVVVSLFKNRQMWVKLDQEFTGIKFIQGGTFVVFNVYPVYNENLTVVKDCQDSHICWKKLREDGCDLSLFILIRTREQEFTTKSKDRLLS